MSGFFKNFLLRLLLSQEEHTILEYLNHSKASAMKEIFQEVPKEEVLKTEQAKKVLLLKEIERVRAKIEILEMDEESRQYKEGHKKLSHYLNSLEEQLRGIDYKLGENFIPTTEDPGEFEERAQLLRAHILGGDIKGFLDETEKILQESKFDKLDNHIVLLKSRLNAMVKDKTFGVAFEHNLARRKLELSLTCLDFLTSVHSQLLTETAISQLLDE